MDIWQGYLGLAISFVIILAAILWPFINPNLKLRYKFLMIPIFIWYAVVLYFTAPKLMGWPVNKSIPDKSVVVGVNILEPNKTSKGGIYLWVISPAQTSDQKLVDKLNPKIIFSYKGREPRAFKLPYSRELHKKILAAQKNQQRQKGSLMIIKKGKKLKLKDGTNSEDETQIKILNPITIMPKE